MKVTFILLLVCSTLFFSTTSCKKTVERLVTVRDTVLVVAKDTVFKMEATAWDGFTYTTNTMVGPGPTTYFTTTEGIKAVAQTSRYGLRIQTKSELGFQGKTIYFKWKLNGMGQFSQLVLQLKYDPLATDFNEVQGKDLALFSVGNSIPGSTLVQNDVWHYTRMTPSGTDQFTLTTATGNYSNLGGTIIVTTTKLIYTKHGYPAMRLGDPFSSSSFFVVGEWKIASN